MKKALIVATKSGFVAQFEMANIELLRQMGYEVHCALNFNLPNYYSYKLKNERLVLHQVDFAKKLFTTRHGKAYLQLKKIIAENEFDLVHCHNPISGALCRLAFRKTKIPVVYTAHGLHFYKGCNKLNWLTYFPVEKYLAHFTNTLITINNEDYARAKKHLHAEKIRQVPGVGLDLKRFENVEKRSYIRKKLQIPMDTTVLLSVGEQNKNKNHITVLKALAKLKEKKILYLLCGTGDKSAALADEAKALGIADKVRLLGFRSDIIEINAAADIFVFPSFREGLSVALMEAMQAKKPVVCSDIRGNSDLIDNNKGGLLFNPHNADELAEKLSTLLCNKELCNSFGKYNYQKVKGYTTDVVSPLMKNIYNDILIKK